MDNIKRLLEQFKVDAIYGKKKHYNASDRKRKYYKVTSTGQIIINTCTGAALFPIVFGEGNKIAEVLALVFTIVATILSAMQKVYDFEKQAQGNAKVGDIYLEISKLIKMTLCMIEDNVLSKEDVTARVDEIRKNLDQANKLGSQFPLSKQDFKKARKGVKEGEEKYTEEELELWK